MATVERILQAALILANESGAARLTTNAMADEAGISVGNLYYHFRNKDDVLLALFRQFEATIDPLLTSDSKVAGLDDWVQWWLQWFDHVQAYSFLFHDQHYLQTSNAHLRFHYHQWAGQIEKAQKRMLEELKDAQQLVATQDDLERLGREVTFIAVFWPDFYLLQQPRPGSVRDCTIWSSALQQMLGLLLPYLRVSAQMQFEQLIMDADRVLQDRLKSEC